MDRRWLAVLCALVGLSPAFPVAARDAANGAAPDVPVERAVELARGCVDGRQYNLRGYYVGTALFHAYAGDDPDAQKDLSSYKNPYRAWEVVWQYAPTDNKLVAASRVRVLVYANETCDVLFDP
jgi:hypothetical protein